MTHVDYEIAGLPLHVLLVHAVVVLTPLCALLLVVLASWPRARRTLWLPALIGTALLLPLGLVTIEAGKWLEVRVPPAPLIQDHTARGESIVPWLVGLLVVAVAVSAWALLERRPRGRGASVAASLVLIVASLAVGTGTVVTLVAIGESGSRAVWEGGFSGTPLER
ncbi:DUF2231 domain-containing protein [Agromyces mediolanus]|uniref:DUF2231 domain-containing protein n=1 Tax=Agromyces mediolanus TaxID=41986 RepID=UPI001E54C314|nr:DUF2231 domain-containing protein [Agromyces mediolanus]MCD1570051.1 hypothetical protein [Agromyces mediolanus]